MSLGGGTCQPSAGKEGAGTTGFLPEPSAQRYLFLNRTDIMEIMNLSILNNTLINLDYFFNLLLKNVDY